MSSSGRKFNMVAPVLWRSRRFKSASSEARVLFLYLLTSEHQNNAGCYRIPEGYACSDLGWTAAEYDQARGELLDLGLIDFDPETETVFIPRWLKHCPPTNQKHRIGIEANIALIECDRLRTLAEAELAEDAPVDERSLPQSFRPANVSNALATSQLVRRASGGR